MGRRDTPTTMIEYDDYWILPLQGRSVSRLGIGYEVKFEFHEPADEHIEVWLGRACLETGGKSYALTSEKPAELTPLLTLVHKRVERALAHKDGRLEIRFQDDVTVSVPPLRNVEAWGLTGRRWLRLVCMPGGDLAIWQADPPDEPGNSK